MNRNIIIGVVLVLILIAGWMVFNTTEIEPEASVNLEGIHIMANGTVMLPSGVKVEGAEVTEDGMIKLPNGVIVEPVMDLREGGSMEGMNMDEKKMEGDGNMPMETEEDG